MRLEPVTIIPPIPLLFGSLILHSPGSSAPLSEDVSLVACGNALGPWSGLINSSSPWAEGEGIARVRLIGSISPWTSLSCWHSHINNCTIVFSKERKEQKKSPPITSSDCVLLWSTKPSFRGHTISEVVTFMFYILIWVMLILYYFIYFFILNWQFQKPRCIKGLYLASFLFRVNFIITDIIGVTLWLN